MSEELLLEPYVVKRRLGKGKVFAKKFYSEKELDAFLRMIDGDRHNWSFERGDR